MCTTRQFVLAVYCRSIQDEVGPSTCLLLFKHIVDLQVLYPDEITIIYLENSKATHTCRSRCVTGRRVCFRCSYIAVCDLVTGRCVGLVCFRCSYIDVICKRVGKGRQFVLAVMTIEKIFKFKHIIQLYDYYLFGKCNFSL